MENVTYYFASNNNEEELNKIVSDPLFTKVVNYLLDHKEQEVILRQIKAAIPTDSNLELYLDKLIKYNLLERKNRRYDLTFPIYTNGESLKLADSVIKSFQTLSQENSIVNDYFVFGEWLWSLFYEKEQDTYFFGVKNATESLPIFRRREEGNDSLYFVSVYPDKRIPLDLANYFHLLSRRQELPLHFESLENIIGDVDIHYFIPQIQKVIRSIKRNKSREIKKNIFQEALLVTGDLKKNEKNQLFLSVPIIESDRSFDDIQLILNKLKTELIPLWENIEDKNQRVFYKQQLYSCLFVTYFSNDQQSIRYFKV